MIGFFTGPNERSVVELVKQAATLVAPKEELRIFRVKRHPDSRALEGRKFRHDIGQMDVGIIDADQQSLPFYASELGSLAVDIARLTHNWGRDPGGISELDHRIMLLTRKKRKENDLFKYFGDYYTTLSLAESSKNDQIHDLAEWIKEALKRATPKVFISYRSSQREFARKVANALRRRGALVWFDEISIIPGDSIPSAINRGLGWCTHIVLVVDETFFDSEWTKAEYESVLYRYLTDRAHMPTDRVGMLIPLFLVDPSFQLTPPMLRRIRGIDCRGQSLVKSMNLLWNAISSVGPL